MLLDKWESIDSFNKHIFLFTTLRCGTRTFHFLSCCFFFSFSGKSETSHKKGYIGSISGFVHTNWKIEVSVAHTACTNPLCLYSESTKTKQRAIVSKASYKFLDHILILTFYLLAHSLIRTLIRSQPHSIDRIEDAQKNQIRCFIRILMSKHNHQSNVQFFF